MCAKDHDPDMQKLISEDPIKDEQDRDVCRAHKPGLFVDASRIWLEGDGSLSQGAQTYIKYYGKKWEDANSQHQKASAYHLRQKYKQEMDRYHALANDIRIKEKKEFISGRTLDVPVFDQLAIPNDNGSNLCWATCMSMYFAYLVGDDVNRAETIAMVIAESRDPEAYNKGNYWHGLDALKLMSGFYRITQTQDQSDGTLTFPELSVQIDQGKPFGAIYMRHDEKGKPKDGHMVLGIGYASAVGHEGLIISNDPAGGIQRIQTYREFYIYGNTTWQAFVK